MRGRFIATVAVLASLGLTPGCTSVDFQTYEGRNRFSEGAGGTRVTVSGVDIWTNGTPPRRFEMLGVLTVDIGEGWGATDIVRSEVASQVRRAGGDAAIELGANRAAGPLLVTANAIIPTSTRSTRFAVVRYAGPVAD
jgi:hypothetical protein